MAQTRVLLDGRSAARAGTGIAHYVRALLKEYAALAIPNVRVLCFRGETRAFHDLGAHPWPIPAGRFFRSWQLPPVGVTHGPDHRILRRRGARTVITVHDLAFIRFPGDYPEGVAAELHHGLVEAQRLADRVICDARVTEQELLELFPAFEGRTSVVPLGVGDEWFVTPAPDEIRETLARFNVSEAYFLHLGAIVPRKDPAAVVRAWLKLRDEHPEVSLVFAGPSAVGWQSALPEIEELVRSRQVDSKLRVLGYVSDREKRCLVAAAVAVVTASKWEGFGLPILESMAAGTPVLATRNGAIPEVGGESIVYVSGENDDELAQGMLNLLGDHDLRRLEDARERARTFSWTACAKATLATYTDLLCS